MQRALYIEDRIAELSKMLHIKMKHIIIIELLSLFICSIFNYNTSLLVVPLSMTSTSKPPKSRTFGEEKKFTIRDGEAYRSQKKLERLQKGEIRPADFTPKYMTTGVVRT